MYSTTWLPQNDDKRLRSIMQLNYITANPRGAKGGTYQLHNP